MRGELWPKTVSKSLRVLMHTLLGFSRNKLCGRGMYSATTPGLLNACCTGCDKLARNCAQGEGPLIVFSINFVHLKAV